MSYQIITDSCCDFTKEQYAKLGIAYVPLTLLYKGQEHEGFTEAEDLRAFYDGIRAGEMPTTSAVNPTGWAKVMEPVLAAGQDVLCMTFSSGLSTTHQSAVIAAEELREKFPERKIFVVDTLCAALGQGLLVYKACEKRDAGFSLEELHNWVEENKLKLCHWVTIDDLGHLKRGGRVSATTAFVGGMLNIKDRSSGATSPTTRPYCGPQSRPQSSTGRCMGSKALPRSRSCPVKKGSTIQRDRHSAA
jgi:DegV family protein with EDD domain